MAGQDDRPIGETSDIDLQMGLTTAQQIEIILAEYAARDEEKRAGATGILSNVGFVMAILASIVALIYQAQAGHLLLILPGIILLFISMECDRQFSVLYQSMYIRLLEEKVNKLAGRPLLNWERLGSRYHTEMGRFKVRHRSKKRDVVSLNPFVVGTYALVVLSLLVYSLLGAGKWMAANLGGCQAQMTMGLVLYEGVHVIILLVVLFNRIVLQPRVLAAVEETLRADLFLQ